MLKAPVLVWSLKLSSIEPCEYLDGWPPGNTWCCRPNLFPTFFPIKSLINIKVWFLSVNKLHASGWIHLLTRFSRVAMKKKTRVQQGLADGKRGTDSMELPGPGSCASLPCSWRINLSPFTKDFRAWKALIAYWNFSAALLYRAVTSLWLVSKVDIH